MPRSPLRLRRTEGKAPKRPKSASSLSRPHVLVGNATGMTASSIRAASAAADLLHQHLEQVRQLSLICRSLSRNYAFVGKPYGVSFAPLPSIEYCRGDEHFSIRNLVDQSRSAQVAHGNTHGPGQMRVICKMRSVHALHHSYCARNYERPSAFLCRSFVPSLCWPDAKGCTGLVQARGGRCISCVLFVTDSHLLHVRA
jgi:hypothetical protein